MSSQSAQTSDATNVGGPTAQGGGPVQPVTPVGQANGLNAATGPGPQVQQGTIILSPALAFHFIQPSSLHQSLYGISLVGDN
ncbi:unnamed protein product [Rhizoctonia solani]|uniref:Uncharacterized protein n=1 Tax=Rhizoctonia solani TaxID=456999 RepID=A0A8H3DH73_9AGAM|nr:unnamed protein product [Rhizoctonia solani]